VEFNQKLMLREPQSDN